MTATEQCPASAPLPLLHDRIKTVLGHSRRGRGSDHHVIGMGGLLLERCRDTSGLFLLESRVPGSGSRRAAARARLGTRRGASRGRKVA